MKRLLFALVAIALLCPAAFAQVTATVTDADVQTWNNGTWVTQLGCPGGSVPTISAVAVTPLFARGTLSGTGALTAALTPTNTLDQTGCLWTFTLQPNASVPPTVIAVPVTSATQNLSSALSTGLKAPRFPAGVGAFGYQNVEILPSPSLGAQYQNVTLGCLVTFTVNGWSGCSGGGGGGAPTDITGLNANYLPNSVSGNTWNDTSGNGYNCTGVNGPTATAIGALVKTQSHQYYTCPAANVNGATTIDVCFRLASPEQMTIGGMFGLVGTDTTKSVGLYGGTGNPTQINNGGTIATETSEKLVGDHCVAWYPGTTTVLLDGQPAQGLLVSASSPMTATTTSYLLTWITTQGWWNGRGMSIAFQTGAALTQAAVQQHEAYVKYLVTGQGGTFQDDFAYAGNITAIIGDSRVIATGCAFLFPCNWAATSVQKSGISPGNYYVNGVGGQFLCNAITTSYFPYVQPLMNRFTGPIKMFIPVGGINDMATGGSSAATVYACLTSMTTTAHATGLGYKVVWHTVYNSSTCTGSCATNLATFNASVLAGCRSGIPDGCADVANIPVLTQCNTNGAVCGDGIHAVSAVNTQIGILDSIAERTAVGDTSCLPPVPVIVPYYVANAAATTQTIPLISLMTGQQVCSMAVSISTAFTGVGTATATIGDGGTGGSATSYVSAPFNLAATGTPVATFTNFNSAAGTIQLNITAGSNLSGGTGGLVTVYVGLQKRP